MSRTVSRAWLRIAVPPAASWFAPEFASERVLSLQEVLQLVGATPGSKPRRQEELARRLVALLRQFEALHSSPSTALTLVADALK